MKSSIQSVKQLLARCLVVRPFLFMIGWLDYVIGLVLPHDADPKLPIKSAVLTRRTDPDSAQSYRSVQECDVHLNDDDNIYEEFERCAHKYAKLKTFGTR